MYRHHPQFNLPSVNHPRTATNQPLIGYGGAAKGRQNFILAMCEMTGILLATLSALRQKSQTKSRPFYHPTHSLHGRYLQWHRRAAAYVQGYNGSSQIDGYLLSPQNQCTMSIHKRQCCNTCVYPLSSTTGQKNRIVQNKVYL